MTAASNIVAIDAQTYLLQMETVAAIAAALSALAAFAALVVAKRSLDASVASARAGEASAVEAKRSADAAEETLRMAKQSRATDRSHAVGLALLSVKRGTSGRSLVYRFSAISFRDSVSHVVVSILDREKHELGASARGINIAVGQHHEIEVRVPTNNVQPAMEARVRWTDRESQTQMSRISGVEVPEDETDEAVP
jgi:hypothetical protein